MFQFLGILIFLAGLAILILRAFTNEQEVVEQYEDRWGDKRKRTIPVSPEWMINLKNKKAAWLPTLILGVLIFCLPYLFFFADRGYNYLLVFPGGKMDAVMQQGIKYRGFAKIDKWQKYIDVKVVADGVEYDKDELEGIMKPVDLRFIDQVTAKGLVSTRFELPTVKEDFIKLAVEFRSMSNLVNNTIIPTVKEQLVQTAYMFAAQNYISGEAQAFRQTFEEQLKSGTYAVLKREEKDTVYAEISNLSKDRQIKEIRTTYHVDKIMENGKPKRIPHELSENKIIVSQVIVDQIKLEDAFKARLEAQRDESAKRQLEQQKIETAKSTQQRIIAEGERDKAAERVAQEKEQVKKLIAIETRLKEEKTNKELAAIALQTERINAEKVKVKADADAYEIKKKVIAGITPEQELKMRLDAQVRMLGELAKTKWPTYYITGGSTSGKGGNGPLESLITAAMFKQLNSEATTGK